MRGLIASGLSGIQTAIYTQEVSSRPASVSSRYRGSVRFRSRAAAFLIAAVSSGLALLLTLSIPNAKTSPVFVPFVLAVMASAWYGGLFAGCASALLNAFTAAYFLFPPTGSFAIREPDDVVRFVIFICGEVVMLWPALLRTQIERREEIESELRESEQRYRTITDTASDAIISINEQSTIVFANPAVEKVFGYARDELIGRKLTMLMPHYLRALHEAAMKDYIATGQKHLNWQGVELSGLHKSGREIPVEVSFGEYIKNTHHWFTGVVRDISERKRAEEAVRSSEKLATVGRLAATIAHEINNPLDAAGGLIHLTLGRAELDETARHYLGLAREELRRIAQIASNTLSFYREAPEPIPVRLTEVLDSVVELYARKIRCNDLTVVREYESEGEIRSFPGEMRQVFSNLIRNALEAVRQGGKVVLHVSDSRDWSNPARFGVRVVVADDGEGIAAEHRKRLFTPFFTTKGQQGTGVGLWITRGIVGKHNGSIHVRSSTKPGRTGTSVAVFFPAAPADARKATSHQAS